MNADGPSPRGRGTPIEAVHPRHEFRAIPARAGNARTTAMKAPLTPGHPRAGGERIEYNDLVQSHRGPSPRGRGTPRVGQRRAGVLRAIPARAGNATPVLGPAHPKPGHPRAGGERLAQQVGAKSTNGPSPRGRGTLGVLQGVPPVGRAIPARAGNAPTAGVGPRASPGHPRAGGERLALASVARACSGPSPRGRGTPPPRCALHEERRAIPARAGNASTPATRRP